MKYKKGLKILPEGSPQPYKVFTPEETREFQREFSERIRPELDRLREAALRSEEASHYHFVY